MDFDDRTFDKGKGIFMKFLTEFQKANISFGSFIIELIDHGIDFIDHRMDFIDHEFISKHLGDFFEKSSITII